MMANGRISQLHIISTLIYNTWINIRIRRYRESAGDHDGHYIHGHRKSPVVI